MSEPHSDSDSGDAAASYCVAVFALVGISVLEAMLVSFLIDLEDNCRKRAQSSFDTQAEIQVEADRHKEPAGAEEEGAVKPVKSSRDLLTLILEEVKAARQEAEGRAKDERKTGFYGRVAEIIDSVFFVLYFFTVIIFLTYMYVVWIQQYDI